MADNPRVSRVWTWNKGKGRHAALLALGEELRKHGYDRVYNLQRFFSSGYLSWRSGAPFRSGFSENPFAFSFHHKALHRIPHPLKEGGYLHEVQRNRLLLEDKVYPPRKPELWIGPGDEEKAMSMVGSQPYVVLAPASQWFTKQWHEEGWAELIRNIPDSIVVCLIGGKEDRALCQRLANSRPGSINLSGSLSFKQSAALMKRAWRVYVNDSAPLHLASAVDAPVTAVFCATRPELGFGPLSHDSRVVISEHPCCSPGLHGAQRCKSGHFLCSKGIDAQEVLGDDPTIWSAALALRDSEVETLQTMSGIGQIALLSNSEAVERLLKGIDNEYADTVCLFFSSVEEVQQTFINLPSQVMRILDKSERLPVSLLLSGLKTSQMALSAGLTAIAHSNRHHDVESAVDAQTERHRLPTELALRVPFTPALRTLIRCAGGPLVYVHGKGMKKELNAEHNGRPNVTLIRWTEEGFFTLRKGPDAGQLKPWVDDPLSV